MNIGELFLTLGVKSGDTLNTLTNFGFKFLTLKKTAEELGNTFENLFGDVMKKAVNLANTNKITGISIKQMQEMKYKAEQVGVSYDDWLSSVKAVQKGVADINNGNNSGLFSAMQKLNLNINDYKEPAEMLNAIMQKSMQYETGYRNSLLAEAGISESMIVMYSEKYKSIKGSLLLTDQEVAQQKELNKNWYALKQTAGAIWDKGIANNVDVFNYAIEKASALVSGLFEKTAEYQEPIKTTLMFIVDSIDAVIKGGIAVSNFITNIFNGIENITQKIAKFTDSKILKFFGIGSFADKGNGDSNLMKETMQNNTALSNIGGSSQNVNTSVVNNIYCDQKDVGKNLQSQANNVNYKNAQESM